MIYRTVIYPCGHEDVVQIPGDIKDIEGFVSLRICMICAQDPGVTQTLINKDGILIDQATGERMINQIREEES